jgi:L-lactate dehydrogenase
MRRLVIVGSGFVGATSAYAIALQGLADEIFLIDLNQSLAKGEAMDINDGSSAFGGSKILVGDYKDCAGSDVIVITAGVGRKPGQSREELLETNEKIIDAVLGEIKPYYTGSFVLVVSNPVDELTTYAAGKRFIKRNKICGTGCMLDTFRWIHVLGEYLQVSTRKITAYAVGKHGSGQRVLWDLVRVDGKPVAKYCREENIEWNLAVQNSLHEKVTEMGAEIISRKGKTQFGIAATVAYIIRCLCCKDYTLVSVGSLLYSDKCSSDLVYMGDYQIAPWNPEMQAKQ